MLITPSAIVEQSFGFYKKHWRHMLPYMGLTFLPTVIIQLLGVTSLYLFAIVPSLTLTSKIIMVAVLAATFVFDIWISIAMARATKSLLLSETNAENWLEIFSNSSHLIWPAFITSLLVILAVFTGLILLVIPGIIFTGWYFFAYYLTIIENKKGFDALRESKRMVTGRWWALAYRLIAPSLVFFLIGVALRYIATGPLGYLPFGQFYLLIAQGTVATIINVLMMPLFYSAGMLLFLSAKSTPISAPTQPASL
ncbi:MAG: hypothetical protein WCT40_03290 [Candidatus Magasanikbacteria bacterium]